MAIDCWTPGLILEHIKKGYVLPHDWRERLERAGYKVSPVEGQESLFDIHSPRYEDVATGGRL